jgi:integrase
MPSATRRREELIADYMFAKSRRNRLCEKQQRIYESTIHQMFKILDEAGLEPNPAKFGDPEIDYLMETMPKRLEWKKAWSVGYQKQNLCILNGFLEFYGNDALKHAEIGWPSGSRENVDWLSEEEAVLMIDAAEGWERIVIHFELRLWMRRIEIVRMKTSFVKEGMLHVHGKGRGGGKFRNLAWEPDTLEELQRYEIIREQIIEDARRKKPSVKVPEEYVIHYWKGQLVGYARSAIDELVSRVAKKAGISRRIGNHTLRRTRARLAYFAGVPLVEIMEALGHTTMAQTMRYIGLPVTQLAKAQKIAHDYLEAVRERMSSSKGKEVQAQEISPKRVGV